jgi:hypothetical protein
MLTLLLYHVVTIANERESEIEICLKANSHEWQLVFLKKCWSCLLESVIPHKEILQWRSCSWEWWRQCEREEGSWFLVRYIFRYLVSLICLLMYEINTDNHLIHTMQLHWSFIKVMTLVYDTFRPHRAMVRYIWWFT